MTLNPTNSVLLELAKPFDDEIVHGTLKLFLDPLYQPEQHSTTIGRVVALPKYPTGENSEVTSSLKVGDEVIFSYSVVANRTFASVSKAFVQTTSDNPYYQEFINGVGERLKIVAFQGVFARQWAATYTSKYGQFIDGIQGSEHDLDRWKSNFTFGGEHTFVFKNKVEANGKDFWRVNYTNIFAKVECGNIIAVNDRCILEPVEIDVTERVSQVKGIKLPESSVQARLYDRATLISGGEEMGLKKGDTVSFQSQFVEKYDIMGKLYFLIKKRRVLGTWRYE